MLPQPSNRATAQPQAGSGSLCFVGPGTQTIMMAVLGAQPLFSPAQSPGRVSSEARHQDRGRACQLQTGFAPDGHLAGHQGTEAGTHCCSHSAPGTEQRQAGGLPPPARLWSPAPAARACLCPPAGSPQLTSVALSAHQRHCGVGTVPEEPPVLS